ncbi:hypothetical protein J6590_029459 [Homalodisca vitripennis]|nr:hypothetical protein J6590_029459 [Homalodisca vitripennis]
MIPQSRVEPFRACGSSPGDTPAHHARLLSVDYKYIRFGSRGSNAFPSDCLYNGGMPITVTIPKLKNEVVKSPDDITHWERQVRAKNIPERQPSLSAPIPQH